MSGGHFDYKQYNLDDMADGIERLVASNDSNDLNEYGEVKGHHYPTHVIDEFKQAVKALRRARVYVQRIDWLVSGDDNEESFMDRLVKELGKL